MKKVVQQLCQFEDPREYLLHLSLGLALKSAWDFFEKLRKQWPANETRSLAAIAETAHFDPPSCLRLLRLLAYLELIEEDEKGEWRMPDWNGAL
ncbi:MAG: hypothetical protein F9K32_05415 [Desulfobulbaceae bacterium]|nr:MAG: hypothetical protein F9K32_05415 [Desulfobulbaceae bacterium]